jgi:5-methylcytosine-specific restriction endonuclease McrA
MAAALVLNATYEPLCIVPLRRAVVLVLAGKADVISTTGDYVHSERLAMAAPNVVRLSRYVRIPYRRGASLTRRAVLDRDGHLCGYCDARADTIDHIVPRSRGGRNEWTNVVAACAKCNHRKGSRLLSDLGWALRTHPVQPPASATLLHGWGRRALNNLADQPPLTDPSWMPYLAWNTGPRLADDSPSILQRDLHADLRDTG